MIWQDMKRRCENPERANYKYYGARGITYDPRWESFKEFWNDMEDGYRENLTLDRIDSDGNYEKQNCQWITAEEQNRKHRNYRPITLDGVTKNLCDWARSMGLLPGTVRKRIIAGWPVEKALGQPPRQSKRWP